MRLIDADRLVNVLSKYEESPGNFCFENEYECGCLQMLETIGYEVEDAPTIEAVPVVHGHWIDRSVIGGIPKCECSECEMESPIWSRYCPNCGARMDRR